MVDAGSLRRSAGARWQIVRPPLTCRGPTITVHTNHAGPWRAWLAGIVPIGPGDVGVGSCRARATPALCPPRASWQALGFTRGRRDSGSRSRSAADVSPRFHLAAARSRHATVERRRRCRRSGQSGASPPPRCGAVRGRRSTWPEGSVIPGDMDLKRPHSKVLLFVRLRCYRPGTAEGSAHLGSPPGSANYPRRTPQPNGITVKATARRHCLTNKNCPSPLSSRFVTAGSAQRSSRVPRAHHIGRHSH